MATDPYPQIPAQFRAGDTLSFTETHSAYPASDGWTLHYGLFNAQQVITLNAVADGDDHKISQTADQTTTWMPGRFDYTRYVTHNDGRRLSLSSGSIKMLPDLGTPFDGRSHARKMMEAIEALLENRAGKDELDLLRGRFKEREIERDRSALITAHAKYQTEVASEDQAAALARGEKTTRNIKARFTR